jgi:para-aminobenzoate synthetase component 1
MPDTQLPLVVELDEVPDMEQAFVNLSQIRHCLFLDSALRSAELGRYSFLAADPFEMLLMGHSDASPLDTLQARMKLWQAETLPGLPPFQGGAAGLFSYDLAGTLERVPNHRCDEFNMPTLALGCYDVVLAVDHVEDRAWIISQGFPETDRSRRLARAEQRLQEFRQWLAGDTENVPQEQRSQHDSNYRPIDVNELEPQHEVAATSLVTSNFSAEQYLRVVARAIEYIHAGDLFQVNIAQRLLAPALDNACELYLRLRQRNPATFAGYFDTGDFQIVSASPERFVQVSDRKVETRPIKGTRGRSRHVEADLFAGDDLRESEKDRAENVMIVDLLRNDLSRVCCDESVVVTDLCKLEVYETVQHLVSVVEGRLQEDATSLDLLRASFPGGSITGAPKVRAMEIIAELEPTARGPYCGSLAYVGFDGWMDASILIRTITAARGWWQMPVGGGIVAQSDPAAEYEETWHKAEGLLRALRNSR